MRLAQAWPELVVVAEAENGAEALALAAEFQPDIAFLDIRMPVKDGLAVAEAIGDECHIVFVTAYDEYAVTAFEQGAVDYLLKPVTAERIAKVVVRLQARVASPPADLARVLAAARRARHGRPATLDQGVPRQLDAADRGRRSLLLPRRGQVHQGGHCLR